MSIKHRISYLLSYSVGIIFSRLCRLAARLGTFKQSSAQPATNGYAPGISVIIPERDNPVLLAQCLAYVDRAIANLNEPCQVTVIANGASATIYSSLYQQFPLVEWVHVVEPLGFSAAIAKGLPLARYDWVFLLNNDMKIEPDSIRALMDWRTSKVFSIGCQIFFEDPLKRREETGLTGIKIDYRDVHLFDREVTSALVQTHLYSGGGASLFRKSLLVNYIEAGKSYDPFYWEDVDWGVRASLDGYDNLFIPHAKVWHLHRATVNRFYSPEQVNGIFNRNKWIFYLRFGWQGVHPFWLGRNLRDTGNCNFRSLRDLLKASYQLPYRESDLHDIHYQHTFYFPIIEERRHLPWLVLVIPFVLFPAMHGAAVRIFNLYRHMAAHYNIWLISDEGDLYQHGELESHTFLSAVTLLKKSREDTGSGRLERMTSHARAELRKLLERVIDRVNPDIVQIEHEELCELIYPSKGGPHWAISLHDVYIGAGEDAQPADARLLKALANYDFLFTCSSDDADLLPLANTCIENGVNPEKFSFKFPSNGKCLLFVGPFRYLPNRLGIEAFITNVWGKLRIKYPDLTLKILAGFSDSSDFVAQHPLFTQKGIELINATNRVEDYLSDATLVINPLTGVRGSCLKTIEAIAAGRVCVSLLDAARGFESYKFPGLKIADDWDDMLRLIEQYLDDPELRHRDECAERERVAGFYWEGKANQQYRVYQGGQS